MKKSFIGKVAILAVLSTSALSIVPSQSQALVGAATANLPLMVAGAGILAAGGLGMLAAENLDSDPLWILTSVVGLFGFVLLDSNQHVSPQFTALDDASASKLGLTVAETTAYNSELPQINDIYQTISQETADEAAMPRLSAADLDHFASDRWETYGSALSPDANSALTKVRAGIAAQLAK